MPTQAELEQAARELDAALGPPRWTGEWDKSAEDREDREELAYRLEKAVLAGELDSRVLSDFDAHGVAALSGVPEDVAKSFGLPHVPRPSLAESRFVPWWMRAQIKRRERADQLSKAMR